MEFKVLGQPYRDWPSGESFLETALTDSRVDRLLVLTAWLRASGFAVMVPWLKAFGERGGEAEMFVGIDLHGTTHQGLELAFKHVDEVRVVHDIAGRTFHPKLYLATGPDRGYALIGSHNLTAGGLSFNYEGSMAATFDPRREPDLADGIRAYAKAIRDDGDICVRLDTKILSRLADDGLIVDETKDRRHADEDRTLGPTAKTKGTAPLFSASKTAKRSRMRPPQSQVRRPRGSKTARARMAIAPDTWSKQLQAGEAQRPAQGNPTGVIRLTAPANRVDREEYFRQVFFVDERWTQTKDTGGNDIEVASARFDVTLGARALGRHELELDFALHRNVPPRGRATTLLHLGPLTAEFRRVDFTDWHILIERGATVHRLVVTPNQPT